MSLPKKFLKIAVATVGLSFFLILFAGTVAYGLTPPGEDKVIKKEVVRSRHSVPPSCDQISGLCDSEQRLLLSDNGTSTLRELKKQGCTIKHGLKSLTSLSCPKNIKLGNARAERAFRVDDFLSARHVRATETWTKEQGMGEDVRIAILDTGVQSTHPELDGKILAQADFTGTGFQDAHGHGTHVAGIISGRGVLTFDENSVMGVSPLASFMVGKVCRDDGWCLEGDILAGIEWAVREKAQVINLSLGGGAFRDACDGDVLASAANWAVAQGSVVVAAAGNTGDGIASPACASDVIAVGAVDFSDAVPTWSGNGNALDVLAPGVAILSSYSCDAAGSCPGSWYAQMSGTSMSAPHVASLVAIILGRHPQLTPRQVTEVIQKSAVDIGTSGYDTFSGHGRVDALAAYTLAENAYPIPPEDSTCIDLDRDGVTSCTDCSDTDRTVYPGATEQCNETDDDCDGLIDEQCTNLIEKEGVTACGNGICEGAENGLSCATDCASVVPPKATEASQGRAGGSPDNPSSANSPTPSPPSAGGASSRGNGSRGRK